MQIKAFLLTSFRGGGCFSSRIGSGAGMLFPSSQGNYHPAGSNCFQLKAWLKSLVLSTIVTICFHRSSSLNLQAKAKAIAECCLIRATTCSFNCGPRFVCEAEGKVLQNPVRSEIVTVSPNSLQEAHCFLVRCGSHDPARRTPPPNKTKALLTLSANLFAVSTF